MKGLDLEKKAESVEGAVVTPTNENNAIVPFDMKQTKHEIITQFSREELAAITDQMILQILIPLLNLVLLPQKKFQSVLTLC